MPQAGNGSLLRTAYRFYIIGKFLGLSCYSIKKDKNKGKYTEVTRYDLFILIGFLCALIFLTYKNMVYPINISNDGNDKIFNITAQLIMGLSPLVSIPAILKAYFDREHMWRVFFDIMKTDKRMKKLGIVINHSLYYRNVSIYMVTCYTAFLLSISMFSIYLMLTQRGSSYYVISCIFVNATMTVILNQFHLILAVLLTRFKLLNDFILNTFKLTDNKHRILMNSSTTLRTIVEEVTRSHEVLNTTAMKTNYLFSYHMLVFISAIFCLTIFPIYEMYRKFLMNESLKINFLLICLLANTSFHNIMWLMLVMLATLTKTTSDQTAVIAHKAISKEHDKRVILQLKLLSQQILHRAPNVGCSLFSYDWPFVFTYISAMASYLIILIQFQSKFDVPEQEL